MNDMTALEARELLAKYGLKSDVKSIRARIDGDVYWSLACRRFPFNGYEDIPDNETDIINRQKANEFAYNARQADLTLLCSLAEKGERYDSVINLRLNELETQKVECFDEMALIKIGRSIQELAKLQSIIKDQMKLEIITEAEGEGK